MSFNKHRHAQYTSKSRHYFQNSISRFGGSAARDDYFAPNYGQKSPELGGSAAGAYSAYSDQEDTESEREELRCVRSQLGKYDKDRYKSRSFHDSQNYREYSSR